MWTLNISIYYHHRPRLAQVRCLPGKKLDPPNKVEKNRKSKPKQPRDAKARRQVRYLSRLEVLPKELLQQIFFYSLNLNFTCVSTSITAAITNERIYGLLILQACWKGPEGQEPCAAVRRYFAPMEFTPLSTEDRTQLQSVMFQCPWFTADRLRAQVSTLMMLNIHQYWLKDVTMEPQQKTALAQLMSKADNAPRDFHGDGPPLQHFLDKLNHPFDEHNRREYLSSPGAHSYDLHISDYMELEIRRTNMPKLTDAVIRIPAISLLCIPDHLYRGDSDHFPTEDLKTLETLRLCSGLFLAPGLPPLPTPITINRPALHRGVKMSIKSKDFVALTSLLKLEEYCIRFGTQVRDHIYLISEEHFIRVARLREHPIKKVVLFRNLLRASAESVPPMSEEVIAWNNKNKTRPACKEVNFPKFAHWLSDFMLDLPNDVGKEKDQMKRQLFYCGGLDHQSRHAEGYLEAISPKTLGPWMPASSGFPVQQLWQKSG
ncbi:hypothetical protein N7468_002702 [Penicillium chermesinum]|uniref:Uncharacterized protein n=1 Tax=Penicillium chermesinum TaxID=63820 RepID=A0A9W9TZV2_9EURO|nr:uncharacterized protein N7468_002702 [Penicillium chermesinum]KAJ5247719.1 hypothetical protein N7468_002702 [Penicillium chermesinum]